MKKKEKNNKWVYLMLAVVFVVVAGLLSFNYIKNLNTNVPTERIAEVLESPEDYAGERILVSGEVESIIGDRTITIDSPELFSERLLVISRLPLQPIGGGGDDYLFYPEDNVSVNGTVRTFHLHEIEQLMGEDLPDIGYQEWEGKPVIIADSVEEYTN